MFDVNVINLKEQARTIENEEPIIETGRFQVYEKGNRGKIDGEAYRKLGQIASDMGYEYVSSFTMDEKNGATEVRKLNFMVDAVGYVVLDKTTMYSHSIIAPELIEMGFAEHLKLTINFFRSFDEKKAEKQANLFQELLDDLDREPVEGTEMELA